MSQLVFIRHAETDLAGTFCGHADPPLNTAGHQQIKALLTTYPSETFDTIYSSDLRRTITTAEAFTCPIITTPCLREINFGHWEALTWAQIEQRDPLYAQRWLAAFPALPAPNGEAFPSFESRVLTVVNDLLHLAEHQRIAVITHAGVMRVVLHNLLGHTEQQAWELTKPYCSSFSYTSPRVSR